MDLDTIRIIALVFGLIATVLALIFIVPEKRRKSLNKFGKFLHDTFNFKYLIIEKILQACYIFLTAVTIFIGFLLLFYVEEGYHGYYYSTEDQWYGGYGLLMMIVGPIIVRVIYEFAMMTLLLVKNVIQINKKIKSPENDDDPFAMPNKSEYAMPNRNPAQAPVTNAAPIYEQNYYAPTPTQAAPNLFCANCGTKLAPDGRCPSCYK